MSQRKLPWRLMFRLLLPGLILALSALNRPRPTAAHPLGNFSVNRFSHILLEPERATLRYVVDMAEIPVFQLADSIDADGDGVLSVPEASAYALAHAPQVAANLHLRVDGRSLPWVLHSTSAELAPGQAALPTMRIEWTFMAERPSGGGALAANFEDTNYADRLGWREVVVSADSGAGVAGATVPEHSISNALRAYPEASLAAPPAVTTAAFHWLPSPATPVSEPLETAVVTPALANLAAGDARLAGLIAVERFGPGTVVIALSLAVLLGALHALSPGHGKTIVGAYLVGARGTPRHALFLGLTTTITHTAGVFAFGLLVLFASRFIVPERLYPWLGVASGALVALIGATLVRNIWQRRAVKPDVEGYHYHLGFGHTHAPRTDDRGVSWRNLLALGVSGGLLPCPSALILLLAAIALGRVAFGLLLISAFSIGLAGVLTAIGLALVYAGRLFERTPLGNSRIARIAPVFSALFVTFAGLAMTYQALLEIGVI